jgi:hypothetical protein
MSFGRTSEGSTTGSCIFPSEHRARQLAKLVGTIAWGICRLEDAGYEGHSLAMLGRIAAALDKRVEIRFLTAKRNLKPA